MTSNELCKRSRISQGCHVTKERKAGIIYLGLMLLTYIDSSVQSRDYSGKHYRCLRGKTTQTKAKDGDQKNHTSGI